jgi:hypothetical protein
MGSWFLKALWQYMLDQVDDALAYQAIREQTYTRFPKTGPVTEFYLLLKWVAFRGAPTLQALLEWLPEQLNGKGIESVARKELASIARGGNTAVFPDAPPVTEGPKPQELHEDDDETSWPTSAEAEWVLEEPS